MKTKRKAATDGARPGTLAAILDREAQDSVREGPPDERRQHSLVTRDADQNIDQHGDPAWPFRGETLLERLERAGDITTSERMAGETFQRLFRLAELDTLRASDPSRAHVDMSVRDWGLGGSEWARNRISEAFEAVGGWQKPAGLCMWHVLGLERSIREFAQLVAWGPERRPLHRETVKGTLIGALGVLERFFGYA